MYYVNEFSLDIIIRHAWERKFVCSFVDKFFALRNETKGTPLQ